MRFQSDTQSESTGNEVHSQLIRSSFIIVQGQHKWSEFRSSLGGSDWYLDGECAQDRSVKVDTLSNFDATSPLNVFSMKSYRLVAREVSFQGRHRSTELG